METMKTLIKNVIEYFTWSKWKICATIWPYPEGYGVYRKNFWTGERMILDTGLSYEEAKESRDELNN